jgi:alkylation response protein AidB-like acyl-CoA dehydrogenase
MDNAYAYETLLAKTAAALRRTDVWRLDNDTSALKKAFERLYEAGIFAFYRYDPADHERMKLALFSEITPVSGALAFLGIQILAANKIMQHNAFAQKESYFAKRCGIAVNHLRAPATVVSAVRVGSVYRLTGRLSWASGYGIFDHLLAGFHCDGHEMQAVIPFASGKGFDIDTSLNTFGANAMNTVNITLCDYEIPEAYIVASHPIGTYTQNKSLSKTVHYALYGIGLGALEAIRDEAVKTHAAAALERIKTAFLQATEGQTLDALRVDLFLLLQQTLTAGMILEGGGAVLTDRPLQRYYRELIMFNANGLNTDLKNRYKAVFLRDLAASDPSL